MGDLRGCLEYNIKVDPRELLRVWTTQCKRKQTYVSYAGGGIPWSDRRLSSFGKDAVLAIFISTISYSSQQKAKWAKPGNFLTMGTPLHAPPSSVVYSIRYCKHSNKLYGIRKGDNMCNVLFLYPALPNCQNSAGF